MVRLESHACGKISKESPLFDSLRKNDWFWLAPFFFSENQFILFRISVCDRFPTYSQKKRLRGGNFLWSQEIVQYKCIRVQANVSHFRFVITSHCGLTKNGKSVKNILTENLGTLFQNRKTGRAIISGHKYPLFDPHSHPGKSRGAG